jgi:hypothetical protein
LSAYIDHPVSWAELRDLRTITIGEEIRFFDCNRHLSQAYRDRLIAVALCQGAALQYLQCGYGVKDFDVHFFYSQNPAKPRLSRAVKSSWAMLALFVAYIARWPKIKNTNVRHTSGVKN